MRIFKVCKVYIKKYKMLITLLVIISILSNSILILSPYIAGNFIDTLISNPSLDKILEFCVLFASLNLFRITAAYITSRIYTIVQCKMGYEFNRDLIQHTQKLPISYFHKKDLVFLSQIQNTDTNKLIIFCITAIQNILINFLYLISTTIIIIKLNPVAAAPVIIFLILYILSYYLFRNPIYNISKKLSESQAKYFSKSYEQFKYIKYIKVNSLYASFRLELDKAFEKVFKDAMKNQKVGYLFNSTDSIIVVLMQLSIYIIGGIQIIEGNFTIGMFTIFLSYFSIMISSVKFFFNFGKTYQDALVSYNRVEEILSQPTQHNSCQQLKIIDDIQIKDLYFKYIDKDSYLFDNLNMNFTKGNIYGIVGANGSGKSTLIDIIFGLYINEFKGTIKYNNINMNDLNMIHLRENNLGLSLQEPLLLNESIVYNIALRHQLSNDELNKINYLIKTVGLDTYINKLDKGLDTVISPYNDNISGGEKQKISIIKVLFANSDLMVFDEPTSALDVQSIMLLTKYLAGIKKDKIIIIISHDKSLYDLFDSTYYL